MDFDALVEAQTGLGTAAIIVMNKQVSEIDRTEDFISSSLVFMCQENTRPSAISPFPTVPQFSDVSGGRQASVSLA